MKKLFDFGMDGKTATFSNAGINWMWYLEVRYVWPHGRCTVEILKHWRQHKFDDDNHPETVGRYDILENTKRQACAVEVHYNDGQTHTFAVENVDNVFSYR